MPPPARRHPCLYALMCAPARARRQTENDRTPRMYKPREEPRGRKAGIATVGRTGYCVTMLPPTLCSGGGTVPRRRLVGATIGRPGKVNKKRQNRRRSRATDGRPYRRGFRSAAVIDGTAGDHWSPLRRQPASLHGRGAYARASEMPIKFLRGRGTFFKKCPAGAFLPQGRFSLRKKPCFSRKSVFPLPNTTHSAPRERLIPPTAALR